MLYHYTTKESYKFINKKYNLLRFSTLKAENISKNYDSNELTYDINKMIDIVSNCRANDDKIFNFF